MCDQHVSQVADLGYHPLADYFPAATATGITYWPLRLMLCQSCSHVQSQYVIDRRARYQDHPYCYDSWNSEVSRRHFRELAHWMVSYYPVAARMTVIEIGSNTGGLLQELRDLNIKAVGIEPSENVAKMAASRTQAPVINRFFDAEAVVEALRFGDPSIIVATNVFNHIHELWHTMDQIRPLIEKGAKFVVEVPSLMMLLAKGAFDTIYHEHVNYFSVTSLRRYLYQYGLVIERLEQNEYMGGTMRLAISDGEECVDVQKAMASEKMIKLNDPVAYKNMMKRATTIKTITMQEIYNIKAKGCRIIGVGAAAKGNTFLQFCGINNTVLDFIADASQLKIGRRTPGTNIPIERDKAIDISVNCGLILPWNIGGMLKEKLSQQHPNIHWIIPGHDY